MTEQPETPWLTVKQAAARAQCGCRVVYDAIDAGRLRAARLGARNVIRIHLSWLDAWLEASATPVEITPPTRRPKSAADRAERNASSRACSAPCEPRAFALDTRGHD